MQDKYPANYFELCLECNESIYLGMGGPKNMLNHIGKAWCCQLQQKRSKEAGGQAQAMLMASFFWKKEPIHPTVVPPTLVQNISPMPSLSPLALHTVGPQKSLVQLDKGIKSATPLSRLRDISGCLPNMVPLAVPSDPVVGLAGDPREIIAIRELEEPDEHPYEWLNKVLNSICGKFAKWNKILPSAVRVHWDYQGYAIPCNTSSTTSLLLRKFWRYTSIAWLGKQKSVHHH